MHRISSKILSFLLVISFLSACKPVSQSVPAAQADPGNSAAESTSTPANEESTTPSTGDLIKAALESGEIDSTTALKYKLYAQFLDQRLPAKYQGSPDQGTDSHAVDELASVFNTLSAEDQKALMPFLMPPAYEGSWADLESGKAQAPVDSSLQEISYSPGSASASGTSVTEIDCRIISTADWFYKNAGSIPVRVWWLKSRPADEAVVDKFIAAMNDKIWKDLTGVMGLKPIADDKTTCSGGSADLDIYVTPEIARSYASQSTPPGCRETPSFIVLNPSVTNSVLAHEFMHVIQWSVNTKYDCMYPGEYAWLAEATAEWAMDFIYPDSNEERTTVNWFYEGGSGDSGPSLDLRNDKHEYGAYLFFFYLTHKFENNSIVKTAWQNTTSMKSLEAVDKAIPGGIKAVWADFAVANWIEQPKNDYQTWDGLTIKPSATSLVQGELKPGVWKSTREINDLSIKYEWYTFTDDSRLVTYINGWNYTVDDEAINTNLGIVPINDGSKQFLFTKKDPMEGIKVQAYFKVAGETKWQLEDWTDKPYVSFCRDAAKERLTDLVIITSDSKLPQSSGSGYNVKYNQKYPPRVEVSSVGCYQYTGTASMILTATGSNGTLVDEQVVQNVVFERTDAHPNIPYPILTFNVKDGQWNRTTTYNGKECQGSGKGKTTLAGSSTTGYTNHLYVLYGAISGPSVTRYSGSADTGKSINATVICPDNAGTSTSQSLPWFGVDLLSVMNNLVYKWAEDGSLQGTGNLLEDVNNATMEFRWELTPQKETAKAKEESKSTGAAQSTSSSSGGGSTGTSQPTKVPSLPNIPNYPNASDVAMVNDMLITSTSDSIQSVVDFYTAEMVKLGWLDVSTPPTSEEEKAHPALMFMKEGTVAMIQLTGDDEITQIVISEFGQ